ncbi:CotO family spore coat protein [Sutcliffiella deserti]|uniref:CotO family spore coat protein n=1 Tax=Sutcliffiella deserti TaxID=2875501 RepID=UPI001CC0F235|nr:CotO family spore coat protein [Sutcliffiella deserti]
MERKLENSNQKPLLYIQSISNVNKVVPMQSKFQSNLTISTKVKLDVEEGTQEKKTSKIPFYLLSLEEKITTLVEQAEGIPKKICKIVTPERDYVGKVVGYQNEILEITMPELTESIFLPIKQIKELHVIGI